MRNTHSLFFSCGSVEMWILCFELKKVSKIKNVFIPTPDSP